MKKKKEWHVSNSKIAGGDFYGTGIKQKQGRIRENYMGISSLNPKATKKPPKSLA